MYLFNKDLVLFLPLPDSAVTLGKYVEAPTVIAEEGSVLARVGDTVRLKCSAVGYPTPVIGWSRNEEEIVTNYKYEVSINTARNSFKASFIRFAVKVLFVHNF
jgi:hypothetical protein